MGLKVLIYTNGTLLKKLADERSPLYDEFLLSDWLRVSLHAESNTVYSKLVGLPESADNIKRVRDGIKRLVQDRNAQGTKLKIGMSIVIQPLNYREISSYVDMANGLNVDFVNLRVDCVNVKRSLNEEEEAIMLEQLREVRSKYLNGGYGDMFIDFADVLIAPMNGWEHDFRLEPTPECRVHQYRAAINPFGRVAVCDLMAEPNYSSEIFILGFLRDKPYKDIITENACRIFPGNICEVCMPGQKSINNVFRKIIEDTGFGINPGSQFFVRTKTKQSI